MKNNICDYNDFDYKQDYWVKANREYENLCEHQTIRKFLTKFQLYPDFLMDVGCGFGRIYSAYADRAENILLFDYAENLLRQAQQDINSPKANFIRGDAYNLPLKDNSLDLLITIRTLHHFIKPEAFLQELGRVVKPAGFLLLEIPNKRHLLNIVRYLFTRKPCNPFSLEPYAINQTFLNFHPQQIRDYLDKMGFTPVKSLNTSYFRSSVLKNLIPAPILAKLDCFFQDIFSFTDLTPSIYILCQKTGHSSAR